MRKIIILLLLTILSGVATTGYSQQNVNPSQIKISELSDSQVRQIYNEIMGRGLSEQQAIALAMARGFSRQQIDALQLRFEELDLGQQSVAGITPVSSEVALYDQKLSSKAKIAPSEEEKRLFGFNFFNSDRLTFEPGANLPATDSYIIGPGDVISIDIWGASEQSYLLMVDNSGNINIPSAGAVAVSGLTLEQARKKIFDKLVLIYRELTGDQPRTFANIYLGQIKPIKVHVIGDVFAPGSYTLPGTATALNGVCPADFFHGSCSAP